MFTRRQLWRFIDLVRVAWYVQRSTNRRHISMPVLGYIYMGRPYCIFRSFEYTSSWSNTDRNKHICQTHGISTACAGFHNIVFSFRLSTTIICRVIWRKVELRYIHVTNCQVTTWRVNIYNYALIDGQAVEDGKVYTNVGYNYNMDTLLFVTLYIPFYTQRLTWYIFVHRILI